MTDVKGVKVEARTDRLTQVGAAVVGLLTGWYAGWQWFPVVCFLFLISVAAWRAVALLAYIAGALTPDEEGDDDDDERG